MVYLPSIKSCPFVLEWVYLLFLSTLSLIKPWFTFNEKYPILTGNLPITHIIQWPLYVCNHKSCAIWNSLFTCCYTEVHLQKSNCNQTTRLCGIIFQYFHLLLSLLFDSGREMDVPKEHSIVFFFLVFLFLFFFIFRLRLCVSYFVVVVVTVVVLLLLLSYPP